MSRFGVIARFPTPADRRPVKTTLKTTSTDRLMKHVRTLERTDPRAVDALEHRAYEYCARPLVPDGATEPEAEPSFFDAVITERWQQYAAVARQRRAVAKCHAARERVAAGRRR